MYLHRNNKLLPVESEPVEGAEDELYLIAAHKLLSEFRLEFIPDQIS